MLVVQAAVDRLHVGEQPRHQAEGVVDRAGRPVARRDACGVPAGAVEVPGGGFEIVASVVTVGSAGGPVDVVAGGFQL